MCLCFVRLAGSECPPDRCHTCKRRNSQILAKIACDAAGTSWVDGALRNDFSTTRALDMPVGLCVATARIDRLRGPRKAPVTKGLNLPSYEIERGRHFAFNVPFWNKPIARDRLGKTGVPHL